MGAAAGCFAATAGRHIEPQRALFCLFTNLNDTTTLKPPGYLTITSGMRLNWPQFNDQQKRGALYRYPCPEG
jgi:hypothetical protein